MKLIVINSLDNMESSSLYSVIGLIKHTRALHLVSSFIDLLKCILEVNPQRRITPSQALEHDFITMKHLAGKSKAAYAAGCEGVMGKTAPSHTHINPSASFTSSLSGSSNQSLKSSIDSSLNSSDSCEKPLMEGRNLVGNQGIYKVQEFLGQGSFGKVAKCTKLGSPEMYAIKIITNVQEGKEEFESMKLIQVLDPDENHLMKMYECFSFQNVICLVYEILEESLVDFLIKNECKATPLTYVRAIAQQMFQALKALKSIGVVHCDIKLDNIMFADKNSLKFKLIDFGLAVESKELPIGTKIQATPFRAPEVILGLPLDEILYIHFLFFCFSPSFPSVPSLQSLFTVFIFRVEPNFVWGWGFQPSTPMCRSVLGQYTEPHLASGGRLVSVEPPSVCKWMNGSVTVKHFGISRKVESAIQVYVIYTPQNQ
uniref:Protein kinase domain-containing protein n=1 Tax=Oryzias latipes TaxID=8090 RepID=A0A3P9HPY1_ORYLA